VTNELEMGLKSARARLTARRPQQGVSSGGCLRKSRPAGNPCPLLLRRHSLYNATNFAVKAWGGDQVDRKNSENDQCLYA